MTDINKETPSITKSKIDNINNNNNLTPKQKTPKISPLGSERETNIISDNPHCKLPDHYFLRAAQENSVAYSKANPVAIPRLQARRVLTVETWSGRTVMSYESLLI